MVEAIFDDAYEYGTPEDAENGGNAWFGTNWCGTGGNGGVTGRVDAGCRLHDKRYEKVDPSGEEIAGPKGAFASFNQKIVAADLKLAANSLANLLLEPHLAIPVGGLFSIISTYKISIMLAIDMVNHFHFDQRYRR